MAQGQPSGWVGWVYFAGLLMLVRGFFAIFEGILALVKDTVYVLTPSHLTVFNFTAWGWIQIVLGIVLITAAASVFSGRWWGRIVGSIMVSLGLLVNLTFLQAYPIWAIVAGTIDILVLYALLVKGDEARA